MTKRAKQKYQIGADDGCPETIAPAIKRYLLELLRKKKYRGKGESWRTPTQAREQMGGDDAVLRKRKIQPWPAGKQGN